MEYLTLQIDVQTKHKNPSHLENAEAFSGKMGHLLTKAF